MFKYLLLNELNTYFKDIEQEKKPKQNSLKY